jgi:hypothetical protein
VASVTHGIAQPWTTWLTSWRRWEATNKNYRLSNTFDFDAPGTPTGERRKESVSSGGGLGLSESLADWRKRLGDDEPTTSSK